MSALIVSIPFMKQYMKRGGKQARIIIPVIQGEFEMMMNLFQNKTIKLSAIREAVQRDGKCFDRMIMGILRDEWIELQGQKVYSKLYMQYAGDIMRIGENLQCTD